MTLNHVSVSQLVSLRGDVTRVLGVVVREMSREFSVSEISNILKLHLLASSSNGGSNLPVIRNVARGSGSLGSGSRGLGLALRLALDGLGLLRGLRCLGSALRALSLLVIGC